MLGGCIGGLLGERGTKLWYILKLPALKSLKGDPVVFAEIKVERCNDRRAVFTRRLSRTAQAQPLLTLTVLPYHSIRNK